MNEEEKDDLDDDCITSEVFQKKELSPNTKTLYKLLKVIIIIMGVVGLLIGGCIIYFFSTGGLAR